MDREEAIDLLKQSAGNNAGKHCCSTAGVGNE